jgi:hypothetical protein
MAKYVIKGYGSVGVKNTTEDKKNYCSDIIDCIDKYLSIFVKALPFLGLLAVFPLYYYAHEENINLFSHYSSWISILPVIASLEFINGLFVFSFVFVPGFMIYLLNKLGHKEVKEFEWKGKSIRIEIPVIGLYLFMLGFILIGVFLAPYSNIYFVACFICYVIVFAVVVFLYSQQNKYSHKEGDGALLLLSFIVGLMLAYISFFSAIIIAYLLAIDNTGWGFWVFLMLVVLSVGLVLLDVYKRDHKYVGAIKNVVFLLAFLSLFVTPFSATISGAALKKLQLGGGIERVYYLKVPGKLKPTIPSQYIDDTCCDDYGFCLTEMLSIKWAAGDLVYASLAEEKNKLVGTETDKEKTNREAVAKQVIALPGNILFPYSLGEGVPIEGVPRACETQQKLIKAANKKNSPNQTQVVEKSQTRRGDECP